MYHQPYFPGKAFAFERQALKPLICIAKKAGQSSDSLCHERGRTHRLGRHVDGQSITDLGPNFAFPTNIPATFQNQTIRQVRPASA